MALQIKAVAHIVSMHHANPQIRQPQPLGQARNDFGGARGVGRAEIADDRDAVGRTLHQNRLQQSLEHRLVAALRIAALFELRQRHRALAEHLEKYRAGPAKFDQRIDHGRGRIDTVPREAGAITDPKHPCHPRPQFWRHAALVCGCYCRGLPWRMHMKCNICG